MNTTSRKRAQLAASLLGVAVVIPLLSPAVSASTADGVFQISAVSTEDPSVKGTFGNLGSQGSNPGPGGPGTGDPGTGDPGTENPPGSGEGEQPPADVIVASYSCGPLKLDITRDMLAFSKQNEDLFAAGRASEMVAHADGWKMISYSNEDPGSPMLPGFPAEGPKPTVVSLGSDTSSTLRTALYQSYKDDSAAPGTCTLEDNRVAAAENAIYYYAFIGSTPSSYSEGRWITEEGKLKKVLVNKTPSGAFTVARYDSSERFPVSIVPSGASGVKFEYLPVETVDSVGRVIITVNNPVGTTRYQYKNAPNTETAARVNGPVDLRVNSAGLITTHSYRDSAGTTRSVTVKGTTNAQIVANYNTVTGQNWDGTFPNVDQFDLSVPFEPGAH